MASDRKDPIGSEFDRYAHRYNAAVEDAIAFSGLGLDFFTWVKATDLLHTVQERLAGGPRLAAVDLGCGVGNYHPILSKAFGSLAAIDISRDCVAEAARNNPNVAYQTYDGGPLPYADRTFDVAFAICVLHHVPPGGWPSFVAEAMRVLRPGGLFAVYEHNPLNPLTRYVVGRCPFDADAVLLWPRQVRRLFESAGFSGVRSRTILSVPPRGRLLGKLDQMLGGLPFGAQYVVTGQRPPDTP